MVTGVFFARGCGAGSVEQLFEELGRRDRHRIRDDRHPLPGTAVRDLQTGLIYFEAAQLQEATQIGSRAIMTQSAAAGLTYGTFLQNYVCPRMSGMFTCANLRMDLQSPANWTSANSLDVGNFYNNANNTQATAIVLPAAGGIAVVRILYPISQMAAIVGGTALQTGSIAAVTAGETTHRRTNRDGADGDLRFSGGAVIMPRGRAGLRQKWTPVLPRKARQNKGLAPRASAAQRRSGSTIPDWRRSNSLSFSR